MRRVFVLVVLCAACRTSSKTGAPDAALAKCSRFGQTCEYATGKLGTCVERAECFVPPCGLVCQSQH